MFPNLDSLPMLGVPLLWGGLTGSAKVRRHLSGLIRNPEVYFPQWFCRSLTIWWGPYLGSLKDLPQKSSACKSPQCVSRRKATRSKRPLQRHGKSSKPRASLNLGMLFQHPLKYKRPKRVKVKPEWLRKEEYYPRSTHPAPGWHVGGKNCTTKVWAEERINNCSQS